MLDVDVPESASHGEPPEDYVSRVAREKAGAGLLQVVAVPGALVLGADTEVVLGRRGIRQAARRDDAAAMLRRLSGRTHRVLSAVCCVVGWPRSAGADGIGSDRSPTRRRRRSTRYVASGEPMGKAGAYAIQGAAQAFIPHLSGSYSGVMGLPLLETAQLLGAAGTAAAANCWPSAPAHDRRNPDQRHPARNPRRGGRERHAAGGARRARLSRGYVGNIYKGRVQRVMPGMQAAFVEIGLDRAAFLHAVDIVRPAPARADRRRSNGDGTPPPMPSISELVREGQEIVVQVVKDPIGTKGARLTTQLVDSVALPRAAAAIARRSACRRASRTRPSARG